MEEKENLQKNTSVINDNDTFDINELAAIGNEEVSIDLIEQLQNQISKNANLNNNEEAAGDGNLFEEVPLEQPIELPNDETEDNEIATSKNMNKDIDDNYVKKYKAKINKDERSANQSADEETSNPRKRVPSDNTNDETEQPSIQNSTDENINELSQGKITETETTENEIKYMDSLNTIDDNVNYSKYVIYIDPENVEFMESLTVKERKNLINKLLKEQDSVSNTKIKANFVYNIIKHAIIAIVTLAVAIPVLYITINASLETTIDNYRQSQSLFKVLYKEHGKVKSLK